MRGRFSTIIAALAFGAAGLVGCGDSESETPETFEHAGFPFAFEYPADFELTRELGTEQNVGGGGAEETIGLLLDDVNLIAIERFGLGQEVDQSTLPALKREFDNLLRQVDPDAPGGEPSNDLAGFPALLYEPIQVQNPKDSESRYVFLFEGDKEYSLNCQSTPEHREELTEACDQMLETLREIPEALRDTLEP